jgi:hypothetical protein
MPRVSRSWVKQPFLLKGPEASVIKFCAEYDKLIFFVKAKYLYEGLVECILLKRTAVFVRKGLLQEEQTNLLRLGSVRDNYLFSSLARNIMPLFHLNTRHKVWDLKYYFPDRCGGTCL